MLGDNQRTAPKVILSAGGRDFSQVQEPEIQYQGPCGVSIRLPDTEVNLTPMNKILQELSCSKSRLREALSAPPLHS